MSLLEAGILSAVLSSLREAAAGVLWIQAPVASPMGSVLPPEPGPWAAEASGGRALSTQAVLLEDMPTKHTGPELSRGEAPWGKALSGCMQEGRGPRLA